jgi:hypothetical protein
VPQEQRIVSDFRVHFFQTSKKNDPFRVLSGAFLATNNTLMSLFESLRPYARLSLAAALETAHLTCDIFVRQIQQQSWHLDVVWDEFCCSLAGDTLSASMAIHCLNALQRLCIHPERPLVLSEQQAMQFFHSVLPKFLHCDLSEIASELRTLLMTLIRSQPSMQPALQHFVLSTVDAMKSQSESLLESDSAALCALLVESSKLFDVHFSLFPSSF